MFDLTRYVAWGVDAEIRRESIGNVIDEYYKKLNKLALQRGSTPKYTSENVRKRQS